jgi:polyisoprenoid-binding protein YceI
MKKLILFVVVLTTALASKSFGQATWTADKAHSKVGFTITHLMITDVEGSFKNFDSKITASKEDFSDAVVELSADANSVSTDNDKRDEHLKGPDFFEVDKFPKMTFKSTSVKKVAANKFKVSGNLTLHGVTKAVVLDAVLRGVTVNPMSKKPTAGFKVTGTLKRADFNFGAKYPGAMLSDEILLNANTEFVKN